MSSVNPIYNQFFHNGPVDNWDRFRSSRYQLHESHITDFASDDHNWLGTCFKIACYVAAFVFLPLSLVIGGLTLKRALMTAIYPAQSCLLQEQRESIDQLRVDEAARLTAEGYVVRHLTLEKNGIPYSGLLLGHPDTLQNGKWILQACGNATTIEQTAQIIEPYSRIGYNLLLINGPGVGRSDGLAIPRTIGEAQEVGISFLESAIEAQKIVIAGLSLGGAAIGEAIDQHTFNTEARDYLVIRQMTFGRVSDVAGNVFTRVPTEHQGCVTAALSVLASPLVHLLGCEMNNLDSSRKLLDLQIPEVVFQGGQDNIIPESVNLGHNLRANHIAGPTLQIIDIPDAGHYIPMDETLEAIREWERSS